MPIEGVMPIPKLITELREQLDQAGRQAGEVPVYIANASGSAEAFASYDELGVEGLSMWVPWDGDLDRVRRKLDRYVDVREQYHGS